MTDLDDFLAGCDDVIDDWRGSADSAAWAADGSHERDTGGHYYGSDRARSGLLIGRLAISLPVSDEAPDWTEISHLISNIGIRMRDQLGPALARTSEVLRRTTELAAEHPELFDRAETTTHIDDARQEVDRRHGVSAQHSPYGPQRRSHR